MNRPAFQRRTRRAFTIVEIIVVIIIIGVLAAVVAPKLIGNIAKGKRAATEAAAANIVLNIQSYLADGNSIPNGANPADFLWTRPSDADEKTWKGPYVENQNALLDAWGNAFIIQFPGTKNATFDVISYGKGNAPGGDGEEEDVVKP